MFPQLIPYQILQESNFFRSTSPSMPKLVSKLCFSTFLVLSLLANHSFSADPSEYSSFPPTPAQSEYETLSDEYFSLPPNPGALPPSYQEEGEDISQEYQSPPPLPTLYAEALAPLPESEPNDDDYDSPKLQSPAPAPSMELTNPVLEEPDTQLGAAEMALDEEFDLPAPTPPVPNPSFVFPSNYSAEDEVVEFEQEQQETNWDGNVVMVGIIAGVFVVGLAGVVYKNIGKNKKTSEYHPLAKKVEI